MRLQANLFLLLIELLTAAVIGAGCKSSPAKTIAPTSEPLRVVSPLALPTDVSPLLSPLPTPIPHVTPVTHTVVPLIRTPLLLPSREFQDSVARAIADLAERLGVEPTMVKVVLVAYDDFPAQDLGCPSPDKSTGLERPILPAFVTGQLIRLRVAEVEYEYHAHGAQIAFCGQN